MDWKTIPSLPALRAFEATVRHGSLSGAARDLNVTHAAISQHIRGLESELGVSLATRQGRTVLPTPEGEALARSLNAGFTAIAEGIDSLRAQEDGRPLAISVTPLFAELWLVPRLGQFWADHPELPIAIHPDENIVDLVAEGFDLAIRYGDGDWPGLRSELLSAAEFVVVAKPGLVPHPITPEVLRQQKWIFELRRPELRRWVEDAGLIGDTTEVSTMGSSALGLAAARKGLGLNVAIQNLVESDLAERALELVWASKGGPAQGSGYHIATRPGPLPHRTETFIRWLRREARKP